MNIFSKRPLCVAIAVFMFIFVLLLFLPLKAKAVIFIVSGFMLILLIWRKKRSALAIGIVIAVLLACVVSYLYFDIYVGNAKKYFGTEDDLEIEIIDIGYTAPYATYADVKIRKIGDKNVNFSARLECSYEFDAKRRDIYLISGRIEDFTDDTVFQAKRYYNSKGYYLNIISENCESTYIGKSRMNITSFFRSVNEFCESRLRKLLDEDAFGFASAIFLGNRDNIDPALNRDFTQLGISHMIAISGMHLTILIGSIYSLLRFLGVHRKIVVYITISICVFYVGITGATPAILRSGVMYIIMSLAALVFRENDSITSLFATAGIIILFAPNAIYDAAFLLSCFSTLGILIVSPILSRFTDAAKSRGRIISALVGAVSGIAITLAATLFTLPLNAFYFGRIYALLPLTNIIFSLPTTLLLMLSPFAVLFSYVPVLGGWLAIVCETIVDIMAFTARKITELDIGSFSLSYPFVPLLITILIAAILLLILFEVKNSLWIFVPFAACVIVYAAASSSFLEVFNSYDYVGYLNFGRNDMLTVHSLGKTAVVDISYGGRTSAQAAIVTANNEFYDYRINAYILTHYHNYHPATIDKITKSYYIDTVYAPLTSDADDMAVAETIAEICENNGVKFVFYGDCIKLSEEAELEIKSDYVKRSVHPVISVDINFDGYITSYITPAVLELTDTEDLSPTVIFGYHGSSVKRIEKDFTCSLAVYSNSDTKDQYNIYSDAEHILSESDGYKILRIARD